MKLFKLRLLLIIVLFSIALCDYSSLLENKSATLVKYVYYHHSNGKGAHANVFVKLDGDRGLIRYHRLDTGNIAFYYEDKNVTVDDDTTQYNPIANLDLKGADDLFKSISAGYQEPSTSKNKIPKQIIVRNCYSFADILVKKLTGQDVNFLRRYLIHQSKMTDDEEVVITASKKFKKKLRN